MQQAETEEQEGLSGAVQFVSYRLFLYIKIRAAKVRHFSESTQLCLVVVVARLREEFELPVGMDDPDGGMTYAIEECGLHHRVVDHVVKDDAVADFQGLGEGEVAHPDVVSRKARAAAEPIDVPAVRIRLLRPDDRRLVRHLQTVWHVA